MAKSPNGISNITTPPPPYKHIIYKQLIDLTPSYGILEYHSKVGYLTLPEGGLQGFDLEFLI